MNNWVLPQKQQKAVVPCITRYKVKKIAGLGDIMIYGQDVNVGPLRVRQLLAGGEAEKEREFDFPAQLWRQGLSCNEWHRGGSTPCNRGGGRA